MTVTSVASDPTAAAELLADVLTRMVEKQAVRIAALEERVAALEAAGHPDELYVEKLVAREIEVSRPGLDAAVSMYLTDDDGASISVRSGTGAESATAILSACTDVEAGVSFYMAHGPHDRIVLTSDRDKASVEVIGGDGAEGVMIHAQRGRGTVDASHIAVGQEVTVGGSDGPHLELTAEPSEGWAGVTGFVGDETAFHVTAADPTLGGDPGDPLGTITTFRAGLEQVIEIGGVA